MKLIYMGTPQFAVPPLRALIEAGHSIAGVVTRMDKPAGRGRGIAQPPVKLFAQEHGLTVYQPKRVRDSAFLETVRTLAPDVIVVAAFGQILPKEILTLPPLGCINIHASLLPKYRGAAPINWSILQGDAETGITIMRMDEGMDTGAILTQESIPIGPKDTAGTLSEKLSQLGARMIVDALPLLESGALKPHAQDGSKATSAPPLKKENGLIDWTVPAAEIEYRIRGLFPWPGAYSFLEGGLVKIQEAEVLAEEAEPALVYRGSGETPEVGAGRGRLRLLKVQPAGGKVMSGPEFLRGHRGIIGKKFENSQKSI